MLINADYTFYSENFEDAIHLYEAVLTRRPESDKAMYHKMIAEYMTVKRTEDVTPLIDFYKDASASDRFFHYWMDRIYLGQYNFHHAREHFKTFLSQDAFKSKEILAETREYIAMIKEAKKYYDNPADYRIEQLPEPINSEYADLSPATYRSQKEMVFTSSRRVDGLSKTENEFLVFHTSMADDKTWLDPEALVNLGSLPPNSTSLGVSNDDGKMFLYVDKGGDALHYSMPENGAWNTPQDAELQIGHKDIASDFFLNEAEDMLIFASARGYQLDLYESRMTSKGWSKPKPLRGINTKWDEDSPYVTPDGNTIYFSSNREASMGGYDIFKSTWDRRRKKWSSPENLGYPINTIDDEINFKLAKDNRTGFLSSNRLSSFGDYDIFYFAKKDVVIVQGKVMDFDDLPLSDMTLTFELMNPLHKKYIAKTNQRGEYQIEVPENEAFMIHVSIGKRDISTSNCRTSLARDMKVMNKNLVVSSENLPDEHKAKPVKTLSKARTQVHDAFTADITNIYFEEQSYEVSNTDQSAIQLMTRLLEHHPQMKIIIHGHADSHEDNQQELSLSRAESVKKILIDKNVDPGRIEVSGYGDSQLLASADDEDEGRELNRRIEVSIVE